MACARRLLCREAALRCRTPLAATRSITACDLTRAAAAAFLSPAAIAFLTSRMALRAEVRRLRLWLRRPTAWRARLRADLMFAMVLFQHPVGTNSGREF